MITVKTFCNGTMGHKNAVEAMNEFFERNSWIRRDNIITVIYQPATDWVSWEEYIVVIDTVIDVDYLDDDDEPGSVG